MRTTLERFHDANGEAHHIVVAEDESVLWELDDKPLPEAVEYMKSLLEKYGPKAWLEREDWEGGSSLNVKWRETEPERLAREAMEAEDSVKWAARHEADERRELARLKAKYE